MRAVVHALDRDVDHLPTWTTLGGIGRVMDGTLKPPRPSTGSSGSVNAPEISGARAVSGRGVDALDRLAVI